MISRGLGVARGDPRHTRAQCLFRQQGQALVQTLQRDGLGGSSTNEERRAGAERLLMDGEIIQWMDWKEHRCGS